MAVLMLGARTLFAMPIDREEIYISGWVLMLFFVWTRDRRLELPVMKTDCNPPFLHHGAE